MPFRPGETIYIKQPPHPSHLWIILTPPQGNPPHYIIVNVTTARKDSDVTCVLTPHDHPFIQHRSCIYYAKAIIAQETNLEAAARTWGQGVPCTAQLLRRIQQGLCSSVYTEHRIRKFFLDSTH